MTWHDMALLPPCLHECAPLMPQAQLPPFSWRNAGGAAFDPGSEVFFGYACRCIDHMAVDFQQAAGAFNDVYCEVNTGV